MNVPGQNIIFYAPFDKKQTWMLVTHTHYFLMQKH